MSDMDRRGAFSLYLVTVGQSDRSISIKRQVVRNLAWRSRLWSLFLEWLFFGYFNERSVLRSEVFDVKLVILFRDFGMTI